MTEPMPEPTDHLPATRRAALVQLAHEFARWTPSGTNGYAMRALERAEDYPEHDTADPTISIDPASGLVLMEGLCTPGGLPVHRINGQDVPPSVLSAVRAASRAWAVEVRELREDLRQQHLRQQLAERDVTDLRAEVERLQGERAELLGILRSNRPEADEVRQVRAERRETLAAWAQAAAEVERLNAQLATTKEHYQRRTETLTAARDSARSEADRLRADLVAALSRQDDISAEVERLRGLLGVILGRFTERGHPGWPGLRTGWHKVAEVEQWQREAGLT